MSEMLSHCPIASPGLQVSASQRDFKLLLDMSLPLVLPTSPWPVQCPARSNAVETPVDRWACSWDALCLSCWDADPLVNYRTFLGGGAWTSVERWNLLKERRPDLILTGPNQRQTFHESLDYLSGSKARGIWREENPLSHG